MASENNSGCGGLIAVILFFIFSLVSQYTEYCRFLPVGTEIVRMRYVSDSNCKVAICHGRDYSFRGGDFYG